MSEVATLDISSYIDFISPVQDLGLFISNLVGNALLVAGLAFFIFLVISGLQWVTAGQDKAKVEEARNRMANAFIGLAIVAVSWAIFLLVNYFFGLGLVGGSGDIGDGDGNGNGDGNPPAGYCLCGNGECAPVGDKGPLTFGGPLCYTCTADKGWENLDPNDNTCTGALNCHPCP